MGRKSDYSKQFEKGKEDSFLREKELADRVKKKLNKETITCTELAAFLSYYSREKISFSSKKIKQRIDRICELSNGLITKDMFREDPNSSKSKYIFKPEIHGILLTILDTSFFDDRRNDKLIGTREKFYKEITDNIEIYLQSSDKEIIEKKKGIIYIKEEKKVVESISNYLHFIISESYNASELIRLEILKKVNNAFCEIDTMVSKERRRFFVSRCMGKHILENHNLYDDFNRKFFSDQQIMDYLISYLCCVINPAIDKNRIDDYSIENLWKKFDEIKDLVYGYNFEDNEQIFEDIINSEFEKQIIENKEKYDCLICKAKKLFDVNDEAEAQMLRVVTLLAKLWWIKPEINEKNRESINRYCEKAMSQSADDIFFEFNKVDIEDTPQMKEKRRKDSLKSILE